MNRMSCKTVKNETKNRATLRGSQQIGERKAVMGMKKHVL